MVTERRRRSFDVQPFRRQPSAMHAAEDKEPGTVRGEQVDESRAVGRADLMEQLVETFDHQYETRPWPLAEHAALELGDVQVALGVGEFPSPGVDLSTWVVSWGGRLRDRDKEICVRGDTQWPPLERGDSQLPLFGNLHGPAEGVRLPRTKTTGDDGVPSRLTKRECEHLLDEGVHGR
jgi:hypothetical protein